MTRSSEFALCKHGTEGPGNAPSPGAFDSINKARWEVWHALGSLPQETARKNYVSLVSSARSSLESRSLAEPEGTNRSPGCEALV